MTDYLAKGARVALRFTKEEDLCYVTALEQAEDNRRFVFQQTVAEHRQMLLSPDFVHLVVEYENRPAGFMILAGLLGANRSVELKRFVVAPKGLGLGREALRLCIQAAFAQLNAHRLWLDVVDYNERAISLYLSEGFVREGVLRECDLFEGKYASLVIMSMLRREYEQGSIKE